MKKEFQPLGIPIKTISDNSDKSFYKVFSDSKTFVEIQADTATEAMIKSGIEEPFKIIKNGIGTIKILDNKDILQ